MEIGHLPRAGKIQRPITKREAGGEKVIKAYQLLFLDNMSFRRGTRRNPFAFEGILHFTAFCSE